MERRVELMALSSVAFPPPPMPAGMGVDASKPESGTAQLTSMALDVQNELGILSKVVCPKHTSGGAEAAGAGVVAGAAVAGVVESVALSSVELVALSSVAL